MKVRSSRVVGRVVSPLVALLLWSAGCGTTSTTSRQNEQHSHRYHVIDATPAFWQFWEAHEHDSIDAQAVEFRRTVVSAHPELFERDVIGVDPSHRESDLDERLPAFLADLPGRISVMRQLSTQIQSELERYDTSFRTLFPDMNWRGTVYFTVSADAFDGAVRPVGSEPCLLFGIDKIAKIHGDGADLGPLFHHELFHVYHTSTTHFDEPSEDGPHGLLLPLWMEGLAVYVSRCLHPNASWAELLLSDEMVTRGNAALPVIATELRTLLDDATEEQYRDFFLGRGQRTDIPKRVAYFVGYRVADALSRRHTLRELVSLSGNELRTEVDEALANMR